MGPKARLTDGTIVAYDAATKRGRKPRYNIYEYIGDGVIHFVKEIQETEGTDKLSFYKLKEAQHNGNK